MIMNKVKKRLFLSICFIFFCIIVFYFLNYYFRMQESLKYFGAFYSQSELTILEKNINPLQKTLYSDNYEISLKGVWTQETCTSLILMIHSPDNSILNVDDIKYNIENMEKVDAEIGNVTLGDVDYIKDYKEDILLEIKYLCDKSCRKLNLNVCINNEKFLFEIPVVRSGVYEHYVPEKNKNSGYDIYDIYLSPISTCIITSTQNMDLSDAEFSLNSIDNSDIVIKMKYMPVVSNNTNDKKKIHMAFSDTVLDTQKIETITIGEMTYIKSKER